MGKKNGSKGNYQKPKYKKTKNENAEKRARLEKEKKERQAQELREKASRGQTSYETVYSYNEHPEYTDVPSADDIEKETEQITFDMTVHEEDNTESKQQKKSFVPRRKIVPEGVQCPTEDATAAYNFVALPQRVLLSPINKYIHDDKKWEDLKDEELHDIVRTYLQDGKRYSGNISLELENITPLFIGTSVNKNTHSDTFFSPTGQPVIPGSTLRGFMRNLIKIITAGAMRRNEDFVDQHLYYRCIMVTGEKQPPEKRNYQSYELYNEYILNRMVSTFKNEETGEWEKRKKTRKGFLFRRSEDSSYAIATCDIKPIPIENVHGATDVSKVVWDDKGNAAIWTGNIAKNKPSVNVLSNPDFTDTIEVPDDVIAMYRSDKNRGPKGVDLLDEKSNNVKVDGAARAFAKRDDIDFIVPCFYVEETGKVTAFGHGRFFRIPYKHSVGDRVPEAMQNDRVDFADAIFGRKELWAGRVSFEDAELVGTPQYLQSDFVKPLLSANPTSFQLYLKQAKWPAAHWDSKEATSIRGYKQYWHKKIGDFDWQGKTASECNTSVTHKINPLKSGQRFTAKIHFRELSDLELGALLKVFSLADKNQDIVFKIGLGKSLGMGSVRIKATLHVDDTTRYTKLFDNNGWAENTRDVDTKKFITAFDTYAKEQLGKDYASYETSLHELRLMLDWNNTKKPDWAKRIASMSGDVSKRDSVDSRFEKRALLPTPEDIVK